MSAQSILHLGLSRKGFKIVSEYDQEIPQSQTADGSFEYSRIQNKIDQID